MNPASIANLERTLSAFVALVAKLEQIAQDPEFAHIFAFSRYGGPTWEKELLEAQTCLREARALVLSPDAARSEVPGSGKSKRPSATRAGDGAQIVGGTL